MNRIFLSFLIALGAFGNVLLIVFGFFALTPAPGPSKDITYGITWSKPYAEGFRISSQEGLEAVLKDLHIRHVRLPTYWTEIQPEEGTWNFDGVREQIDLVKKYGGTVTLVLGAKQVRWPECWVPSWVTRKPAEEKRALQRAFLIRTYDTFKDEEAVTRWQVENEPLFHFGECLGTDKAFVEEEMAWVRAWEGKRASEGKTPRSVATTDSGELAFWTSFMGKTDALGVSLYRTVLTGKGNRFSYWFVGPGSYAARARWLRPLVGRVYISELQMEPWAPWAMTEYSPDEHFAIFPTEDLEDHFRFAQDTGIEEIHFWGAEWWYFMKEKRGRPEYWETMRQLLTETPVRD